MSEVQTEGTAAATSHAAPEVKVEAQTPAATQTPKENVSTAPEVTATPETKVVPEKYDLKLGEGSVLDQSVLERIEAVARQQGLSQEEAQGLVDKQQGEVAQFIEDRKAMWHKQASEDKEIGGQAFAQNAELAKRAFERVAPEGLKAEMERTGYGNHPLVLKMFVKLGQMMADDKFVQGGGGPAPTSKSAAELLYGQKT